MPRYLRHEVVARLFKTAIANGAERVSLARVRWNIAGDCLTPVEQQLYGRPDGKVWTYHGKGGPMIVDLTAKCRKCENCLKKRSAHWRLRALNEWRASYRSWLVTLTFRPERQFHYLSLVRKRLDKQAIDFDRLSAADQFNERHKEAGREVTRFIKRLRKGGDGAQPSKFRYLLVAEAHQNGLPHYHMMVHEYDPFCPVRHAALKRAWWDGFLDAKLVTDAKQATYATKYLSKSALARVRASAGYGKNALSVTSGDAERSRSVV